MPELGLRQRTVCADCGNRTRVAPSEFATNSLYKGQRVILWRIASLCAVCSVARKDWWTLNGRPLQLHHLPR